MFRYVIQIACLTFFGVTYDTLQLKIEIFYGKTEIKRSKKKIWERNGTSNLGIGHNLRSLEVYENDCIADEVKIGSQLGLIAFKFLLLIQFS